MEADMGHLVTPGRREAEVIHPLDQLLGPARQSVVLDIAHARFNDSLGFRVPSLAGDRLHAEMPA